MSLRFLQGSPAGVTGSHGTAWFGPGFPLLHDSHSASGDVKPSVPVEAFLSRDHVDMEGLLEWQFTRVLLISNSIPMEEDQCVMVKTLARISARS